MIKKLRLKFIYITMTSLTLVLVIIMFFINMINYTSITGNADDILQLLVQNNGAFPMEQNLNDGNSYRRGLHGNRGYIYAETPFETRYFAVYANSDFKVTRVNLAFIKAVNKEDAEKYAQEILISNSKSGYKNQYRFLVHQNGNEFIILFVDCTRQLITANNFLLASILISAVGIVSVFILVYFFSQKAVAPIAESYDRQKIFITNSSHELRTPLTVISTNTSLLELDVGENEWTVGIKKQVERLTNLTVSLTNLARMDETNEQIEKKTFNLSDAVIETINQFFVVAQKQNKSLESNIQNGISYNGNEEMIRRLVSIIVDNAIKYSISEINISLRKQGSKVILIAYNNTVNIEKGNLDYYFERFYRNDKSHSNKIEGFGVGLSIAKTIVSAHSGKINAKSSDGNSFEIIVSL